MGNNLSLSLLVFGLYLLGGLLFGVRQREYLGALFTFCLHGALYAGTSQEESMKASGDAHVSKYRPRGAELWIMLLLFAPLWVCVSTYAVFKVKTGMFSKFLALALNVLMLGLTFLLVRLATAVGQFVLFALTG